MKEKNLGDDDETYRVAIEAARQAVNAAFAERVSGKVEKAFSPEARADAAIRTVSSCRVFRKTYP